MPGWTDPFDPDRTYIGPGDQSSHLPLAQSRQRRGRHAAPEPYDGTHRLGLGGDRCRPILDDPPAESGDGKLRRRSRPVVLAGVATAATLIIIVGIAGLLMPPGPDPTSASGGAPAAGGGPGMAGGDGMAASALPAGFPSAGPTPNAPATRAPAPAQTKTGAPVAPPRSTASPTPRRTQSTATSAPARSATASPALPPAQEVITLVNQERAAARCDPLTVDGKLTTAAQLHSEDQAAHQNMSHTGSDGSSLQERIDRVDYQWRIIGENVAYGQTTPAQVMSDWMNSDGHRENILNCQFEDIGVGVARDADGRLAWTQDFGA